MPRRSASRSSWSTSDLLAGVAGRRFDLIASNPPYIAEAEIETLEPEVARFEPRLATVGGASGTEVLDRLIAAAPAALEPGGWLVVECGAGQAPRGARRRWPRRAGARSSPSPTWPGSTGWSAGGGDERPRAGAARRRARDRPHRHRLRHRLRRRRSPMRARACTRASRGRPGSPRRSCWARSTSLLDHVLPELTGACRRALRAGAARPGDPDRAQPRPPVRAPVRRRRPTRIGVRVPVLAPDVAGAGRRGRRPRADEREPARRAASGPPGGRLRRAARACARSRSTAASWPGRRRASIDVTGREPVLAARRRADAESVLALLR